jgi:non-heme chloroperoxidase
MVKRSRLVVVEGGPHGLSWTHADQVNRELLNFLGQEITRRKVA